MSEIDLDKRFEDLFNEEYLSSLSLDSASGVDNVAAPAEDTAADSAEEEIPADAGTEDEAEPEVIEDQEIEAEAEEAPQFSPEIQAYLEKYGGDLEQALKSAIHQNELLGRQGNELGELRKQMQDLQEQINSRQSPPQQPFSNLEDALEEEPWQVAFYAAEAGNDHLFEQAMQSWYETDPRAAARFEREIELNILRQEFESKLAPVQQPVQQDLNQRLVTRAANELQARYADFKEVMEVADPAQISAVPPAILNQLKEGDLEGKVQAMETIYRWVKADSPQVPQAPARDTSESRAAKKKAAVLTSASTAPAKGGQSDVDTFKKYLLEPEPQSVHHGLTGV